jgi:hypothetical protein
MRMAPLAVSQILLEMQATSHLKKELGIESDPMVVPQPGQIWRGSQNWGSSCHHGYEFTKSSNSG